MNAVKERLKAEAAKAALAAQSSFDSVAQSDNLAKLKEKAAAAAEKAAAAGLSGHLEQARSSFSNLSLLMRAGDEASQQGESSDDAGLAGHA